MNFDAFNSPICSSRGAVYLDGDNSKSYFKVLLTKAAKDVIVRVDSIYAANRRRGQLVMFIEVVVILAASALLLLVPPNMPKWY